MKRQSNALVAAAALAAAATAGFAHPGPRIWLGSSGGTLGTFIGDNDTNPTAYTPTRAFVGGIDEDSLAATGLLDEYPVPGTGIYATEFPAYQVRADGLSGIATGSSFTFDLGPLLVFDSVAHAFKTTRQMFGNPGPAPQMAEVEGSSSVATGPGIVSGYNFFSYNTATDHAHLVTTLLGNGTQAVDGPQAVYAVPLQVTGGGLSQSLPYYVLVGRNIDITQAPFQDAISVVNTTIASSGGTWIVDTDGDWSTAGNWFANVPSAIGASATFGGAISNPRTVSITTPRTIGRLTFDSANRYTLSGGSMLSINNGGAAATIELLSGSHTIAAPIALSSETTISVAPAGSTLTVTSLQSTSRGVTKIGAGIVLLNNVRAGSLTINTGTVTVAGNGGATGTSKVGTLAILNGSSATLDLNDNDLVTSTAKSVVEGLVSHARNNGAWNLPGITTSTARGSGVTGLGVLSGAEYTSIGGGAGTFSGQPYLPSDTLVKYTWNGDANFSGTVDFDDYVRIDTGFNGMRTGWSNGDFNYSGVVDFDDYVLIDVAFNTQSGTLTQAVRYVRGEDHAGSGRAAAGVGRVIEHLAQFGAPYAKDFLAAVPEPASLALFSVLPFAGTMLGRPTPRRRNLTRPANTMFAA